MPADVGHLVEIAGGVLGGGGIAKAFEWFRSRKRDKLDERETLIKEAQLIIVSYKETVEQHSHEIAAGIEERATLRAEITSLRASYNSELDALRGRVRALEDENAGLKRQLAQRSQSTAERLDMSAAPATAAALRRRSSDAGIEDIMEQLRAIPETPLDRARDMKRAGVEPKIVTEGEK